MKHFFKVFILTTIILIAIFGISSFVYLQIAGENSNSFSQNTEEEKEEIKPVTDKERVGILLLGVDGSRADTILFGNYNLKKDKIDLVSIPRDTYYESEYKGAQMKKINAIYATEGVTGMVDAVEDMLGIEDQINYYAEVDYEGVKKLVDVVGGVEVDVPFDMVYKDPSSDPPLDINIAKGPQLLQGQKAVDFLRYRTNNDYTEGYREGDIGRIESQQQFISSFIDRAIGMRLPKVIKTAIDEVNMNLKLKDSLSYGMNLMNIKSEDVKIQTLPGEARYTVMQGQRLSFFFIDEEKKQEMIDEIFSVSKDSLESENDINAN